MHQPTADFAKSASLTRFGPQLALCGTYSASRDTVMVRYRFAAQHPTGDPCLRRDNIAVMLNSGDVTRHAYPSDVTLESPIATHVNAG